MRRHLVRRDTGRAGPLIDDANPDLVPPNLGADESVLEHPLRLVFRVHIRACMKDHDERKGFVVAVQIDAVFATKPHAARIYATAWRVQDPIRYGSEPNVQDAKYAPLDVARSADGSVLMC